MVSGQAPTTLDPASSKAWNRWADGRISRALKEVANVIGDKFASERKTMQAALDSRDLRIAALEQRLATIERATMGEKVVEWPIKPRAA